MCGAPRQVQTRMAAEIPEKQRFLPKKLNPIGQLNSKSCTFVDMHWIADAAKFDWEKVQGRLAQRHHHENMSIERRKALFDVGFINDVKGNVVAQVTGTYRVGDVEQYISPAERERQARAGVLIRSTSSFRAKTVREKREAMARGIKAKALASQTSSQAWAGEADAKLKSRPKDSARRKKKSSRRGGKKTSRKTKGSARGGGESFAGSGVNASGTPVWQGPATRTRVQPL